MGPLPRNRRRHVDDVHIGKRLQGLRKGEVREPEPVAMSQQTALGKTEGLDRRLRKIVNQDGLWGDVAQPLDDRDRFGDVGIGRRPVRRNRIHDGVTGSQPPDEKRIVWAFCS